MFSRGDRVTGWFGVGIVTDADSFDDLIRIMQRRGRHSKWTYRYVMASDATLDPAS